MEVRRSRRLAGLEPYVFHEEEHIVAADEEVVFHQPVGICNGLLGAIGTFLAAMSLGRAVVAVVCAPGYCLF